MSFQKIVLIIAIVVLILALIFIGMALTGTSDEETWPPLVGECPDYWTAFNSTGETDQDSPFSSLGLEPGNYCINVKDLGTCKSTDTSHKVMDFSAPVFTGTDGNCEKNKWANGCNVSWDGITYGYGAKNPCDTTTSTDLT